MSESLDDLYPGGTFLTAADVTSKSLDAKITAVEVKKMPRSGKNRIVLTLADVEKPFALNSTNAHDLAERFGEDYPSWVGKEFVIVKTSTTYNGQKVGALRIQAE